MPKKIQLIIGSTREGRVSSMIADWIKNQSQTNNEIELEIVDLKEVDLPFFNSSIPPAYSADQSKPGIAWAERVSKADGFIFLTAEYNRSIPAPLKNAIDYLVKEWTGKPAAVVSYGYVDGGKNASKHLLDILGWQKMNITNTLVNIHLKQEMFNETGSFNDIETDFAQYNEHLLDAITELRNSVDTVLAKS